jgi:hypothetical protein
MQMPSPQDAAVQSAINNQQIRAHLLTVCPPMYQVITDTVVNPAVTPNFNFTFQNIGLIRGFMLEITALITNPASGSSTLTLSQDGISNLLQRIVLNDYSNVQRINTTGQHLALINSIRQGRAFLSSTPSDNPTGFGANQTVISAPTTIAMNSTGNIRMYYWIPCAYASDMLAGAIFGGTTQSTANVQLTFATSAQAVVSNTSDPTFAMYQGAGAVAGVTLTNIVVKVYQEYLDQIPFVGGFPLLPPDDINTIYELKDLSRSQLTVGSDIYLPFSNYRHFMSTILKINNQNNGVYPASGSDVNTFSIRTANTTDVFKVTPQMLSAFTREFIWNDMPKGTHLFSHRKKPIFTQQTGNTAIVVNLNTVNTNATIIVNYEAFANLTSVQGAATLGS